MALSTQPYKGARDFYPEDKRLQKYMFGVMREVVEKFGYEEYDAPILESLDLYLAKTGEEIVNEQTYTFEDRGGRKVAIRPEMTPTVSRMVAAKRQELAYPLRWYSIPNLWRYERPQKGRLREHWQLNVDLFGVAGSSAEQEVVTVMDAIMKSFDAKPNMYKIRLNHRELIDYVLRTYMQFDEVQSHTVGKLIDRMHKMPADEFVAEVDVLCTPTQRETGAVERLLNVLQAEKIEELPEEIREQPSCKELESLLENLQKAGVTNCEFDATLMRGFDYYTGLVFEVFDTHPENNRSLFGGGRYDGLVGLFGVEPVPTVGFGMGDVTLQNFLETHKLLPKLHSETDVYVVFAGDVADKAQHVITDLRGMGINVAVDMSGRKLGDQIKTADKKGVQYVLVVGEQELSDGQFKLKHLPTSNEETHGLERIVSIVKDQRHENDGD
jgi:histidyl-tRNA synthetase